MEARERADELGLVARILVAPVRRIEGLEGRITAELSRMARDYASERTAAGRSVPEDATYLMSYGA